MESTHSERKLLLIMLVVSTSGMTILGIWHTVKKAPSLDVVRMLAREKQFHRAELA